MIGEYEIPKGSKLYFGESARKKRSIETQAVEIFARHGFEEIVTPLFSYHQGSQKEVIRFGDEANHAVAVRADSALEVVRLILKRLGRSTEHRRWFYVQPVFRYPTQEIHQMGAESIGSDDLSAMIRLCGEVLSALGLEPVLQVGSIAVLNEVQRLLNLPPETLQRHNLHELINREEAWLKPLITLSDPADLDGVIRAVPASLRPLLEKMAQTAANSGWDKVALSPLYHADMAYYDEGYFRFLSGGKQLAMGGTYESGEGRACGFALYTDTLIAAQCC